MRSCKRRIFLWIFVKNTHKSPGWIRINEKFIIDGSLVWPLRKESANGRWGYDYSSIAADISSAFSFPTNISTSLTANENEVPGPWLVIKLPSTSTWACSRIIIFLSIIIKLFAHIYFSVYLYVGYSWPNGWTEWTDIFWVNPWVSRG